MILIGTETKAGTFCIAVLPQGELAARVKEITKEFRERFASAIAFRNIPYIPLTGTFRLTPELLPQLRFALRSRLAEYSPFTTEIRGFAGIPEHTICLCVVNTRPFAELARVVAAQVKIKFARGTAISQPHLAVAHRDLSSENYRLALPEFRERSFHAVMQVPSVYLIQQDRGWKLIEEFSLSGHRDYSPRQMDLFASP